MMKMIFNRIRYVKLFFHWLKFKWCLSNSFGFISERLPHLYSYIEIKTNLGFKLSKPNQIWFDNASKNTIPNIIMRSKLFKR